MEHVLRVAIAVGLCTACDAGVPPAPRTPQPHTPSDAAVDGLPVMDVGILGATRPVTGGDFLRLERARRLIPA